MNDTTLDKPQEQVLGQEAQAGAGEAYQSVDLPDLQADGAGAAAADINLNVILDISVDLSVEIGRVQVPIRELLQFSKGSVVELERLVGDSLDVMVNGTLVAKGEVVVVNDKFGVRLTDVVSKAERVKNLQ